MDDKWFKQQQKRAGVTADQIAAHLGRDRSIVSKIYSGQRPMTMDWAQAFAATLNLSLDEVLSHAGILEPHEAQQLRPGFSESDAAPWMPRAGEAEKSKRIAAEFGGARPGVDIWQIKTNSMLLSGFLKGDQILVDTHAADRCLPGDVVIAQIYSAQEGTAKTLLRRYEPPVLVSASCDPGEQRVRVVDGENVVIRGKVIALWRQAK